MRRTLILGMLVLAMAVLAGCGVEPPAPAPTAAPQPIVTLAATRTAAPAARSPGAQSSGAQTPAPQAPTSALSAASTTSVTPAWPPVASAVQGAFAREIGLEIQEVEIVAAEPMRWADSCLGLALPGEACQQGEVAGLRVTLQVGAEPYVYHVDASGELMRAADAQPQGEAEPLLIWTLEDANGCAMALVGAQRVEFGPCGGATLRGALTEEQVKTLGGWVSQFAPFEAQTPAGYVNLAGRGAAIATAPQQTQIAEWARRLGAGLMAPASG